MTSERRVAMMNYLKNVFTVWAQPDHQRSRLQIC
jgi:hypothetical protein